MHIVRQTPSPEGATNSSLNGAGGPDSRSLSPDKGNLVSALVRDPCGRQIARANLSIRRLGSPSGPKAGPALLLLRAETATGSRKNGGEGEAGQVRARDLARAR